MRILLPLILVLLLTACGSGPEKNTDSQQQELLPTSLVNNPRSAKGSEAEALASLPVMSFDDTVKDFGTIREGETVTSEFTFTNTGKTPLIISSANASCGCTVADYPREPVSPGGSASVSVQFSSAGKPGHQEKSITLITNGRRGTRLLFIKGEVKE